MTGKKIGKRLQRVVDLTKSGEVIHRVSADPARPIYCFEPSGQPCGAATAIKAIELGLVRPNNDGLFEGQNQTWGAA